ncbi:MAG: protein kinase domain-containing protein [Solirubrobacteraceae bacterium]
MSTQLIADRYELQSRLGVGGMSTVHLALDRRLERQVAVKLLAEHLAEDEAFVSRFRREALSVAKLVHPNIVQVFDFGLDEASHRQYIVMEYVPGQSCAEILRDQGRLEVDEAVDVIGQSCRGLDHAHRNGVVHRDVKPGNLLRSPEGLVKLADFGIAKAAEQTGITQAGSVLGTAAYLAPEQARGEPAGPASDIYALGVVAYQMLAGRLPYEATSLTELANKQLNEAPPSLDEVNLAVPPALAHGVAQALSLEPGDRYAGALAMGEALRSGERGVEPPMAGLASEGTAATAFLEQDDGTEATRALRRDRTDATSALPPRPPVVPRPPRPRSPARPQPAPAPAPTSQPRRRRGMRRALGLLFLVLLLAAAGIGAIAYADSRSSNPQLRKTFGQDVDQAVQDLKDLIDDNTR